MEKKQNPQKPPNSQEPEKTQIYEFKVFKRPNSEIFFEANIKEKLNLNDMLSISNFLRIEYASIEFAVYQRFIENNIENNLENLSL